MQKSHSITGDPDEVASLIHLLRSETEIFVRRVMDIAAGKPGLRKAMRTRHADRTEASQFARQLIRERRDRDERLGSDMFGEPAWDMLLDLFIAYEEGRKVSVSSLCIAAAVPPTTALRWIANLTARELITRVADPLDGRRIFLELTPAAYEELRRLIGDWMGNPA